MERFVRSVVFQSYLSNGSRHSWYMSARNVCLSIIGMFLYCLLDKIHKQISVERLLRIGKEIFKNLLLGLKILITYNNFIDSS